MEWVAAASGGALSCGCLLVGVHCVLCRWRGGTALTRRETFCRPLGSQITTLLWLVSSFVRAVESRSSTAWVVSGSGCLWVAAMFVVFACGCMLGSVLCVCCAEGGTVQTTLGGKHSVVHLDRRLPLCCGLFPLSYSRYEVVLLLWNGLQRLRVVP